MEHHVLSKLCNHNSGKTAGLRGHFCISPSCNNQFCLQNLRISEYFIDRQGELYTVDFHSLLLSSKRFFVVWLAALTQENPPVSRDIWFCKAL